MKTRRIGLAGLLALLALLGGCAGTVLTGQSYDITQYFPLRAGDWWQYHNTSTDEYWTMQVTGQQTVNGLVAYTLQKTRTGYSEVDYYRSVVGGLYYLGWYVLPGGPTKIVDPPALCPNGLAELATYSNAGTLYSNGIIQGSANYAYTIQGTNIINVPAGNFTNALRVSLSLTGTAGPAVQETRWYALGLGIVRFQSQGVTTDLVDSSLLP